MRKIPAFAATLLFLMTAFAAPVAAQLTATKTGPATVIAGTTITYTVTLSNNPAGSTVTGAGWSDSYSGFLIFESLAQTAGPTFGCTTPPSGVDPPPSGYPIVCSGGSLTPGQSASWTLTFNVKPNVFAGTLITNAAIPTPGGTAVGANTTVAASADLAITKTLTSGTFNAGTDVTYTIHVSNNGPSDAQNVQISDPVPANASFVSVSSIATTPTFPFSCGPAGSTVTCTTPTFPYLGTATAAITFHISPTAPDGVPFSNTASVTSTTPDPVPGNNTATVTGTLIGQADLSMTKTVPPGPVVAGQNVTYTITAQNGSTTVDSQNVTLTDTPTANQTFVSLTQTLGPAFACTTPAVGATGSFTCTIPSFARNANATWNAVFKVAANANHTGGAPSNTVTIGSTTPDPNSGNNTAVANAGTPQTLADVGVTKTGPATSTVGSNIAYTITVSNAGPSDSQAFFTDPLPAGAFTFVSLTQNTGVSFNCTVPTVGFAGTITCTSVPSFLPPGSNATFTLVVQPVGLPGATVSNTATVGIPAGTGAPPATDPNPSNDSSTTTTTLTGSADVAVTKSAPASVTAGMPATYTVNITNNGPTGAQNITLTDNVPAGTTFASMTQTAGPTFTCTTPPAGSTGSISCTIPNLANGATATFSIVMNVLPTDANGSTISNTATVSSGTSDPVPGNNSATANSTVAASADLGVTKTGPATFGAGGNLTYTIAVSNAGPSNAQSVSLTDVLPPGLIFVSLTQTSGPSFTCTTGGTITCSTATFAAGGTASFSLVVHSSSSLASGTTVSNTAAVTSTTSDPNSSNNSSASSATATASADLSIAKSGAAAVSAGGNLTYTLSVTNNGPADAQSVAMTDALPASTTFTSEAQTTGPTAACTTPAAGATGTVSCTFPTLAAGATASFTIAVHVSAGAAGASTITNTASVSSATADPSTANNSSSSSAIVASTVADLAVTKTASPPTTTPGSNITYTVTLTNNGPSDAQTVALTDSVPANTTFVSEAQTAGPTFACSTPPGGGTGTVSCTIATFANAATATFSIVVKVNNGAPTGPVTNTASVTASTADSNASNNSATASTSVGVNEADLSVSKSGPASVAPNGTLSYFITVTNNGPADAQNVAMTDVVPANTTFVSESQTAGTPFTCTTPPAGSTGTVSCTMLNFLNGTSATFNIVVHAAATATGTIANTVDVTSATPDPNAANNSSTGNTAVTAAPPAQADVSVTKSATPSVAPGANVTYTIVVTNNGPNDAQNVSLTDPLPANTSFMLLTLSGAATSFNCSTPAAPGGTGTVTCTIATLTNGSAATFTLLVQTSATATGSIVNTATVSSSTGDSNPANNTSTATTTIAVAPPATADLAITKTTSTPAVMPGGTIVYTIGVTNNGPGIATGVVVTDVLPAGTTYVSAVPSQGMCGGTTTVTCSLGTMANAATATITLTVTAPTAAGTISNSASVSSATSDSNTVNNASTAAVTVGAAATNIPTLSDSMLALVALALLAAGLLTMKR